MMVPSTKSVSGNLCGQEKETEEQVRGDDRANEVGCAEGAVEAMQLPETGMGGGGFSSSSSSTAKRMP